MIKIIKGNIFASEAQTLVNTVNCVGVMGAGIAFEFRLRYPEMFSKYVQLCNSHSIVIGSLWLYKSTGRWVLNFPTKFDWKFDSKIEYLEKGLEKFVNTYEEKGITSIAFPVLGASNGGLNEDLVIQLMQEHLSNCNIPIEIYRFDPSAPDDLYGEFKSAFLNNDAKFLSKQSGIGISIIKKLQNELMDRSLNSMNGLLSIKGVGEVTLEKAFQYIMNNRNSKTLFDEI